MFKSYKILSMKGNLHPSDSCLILPPFFVLSGFAYSCSSQISPIVAIDRQIACCDSNGMHRFCLFALALIAGAPAFFAANVEGKQFNVRTFGAVGDGTNLDTAAFQRAFDACKSNGGGTVIVPGGRYLIGSVVMGGHTTLKIDSKATLVGSTNVADYPLTKVRFEGEFIQGHRALISAENANRIAIEGSGTVCGPPLRISSLRKPRGPVLIELSGCTNVTLDGFSTKYQRLWSIHPLLCKNVVARNLIIRSTGANGDGIDVDSCQNVLINHCDINTGDDAISLKSGRGTSAMRMERPTEDVTIEHCTLVSSTFAAVGIGTELSGGIRNTKLEDCVLSGHQNGIFLKSRDGRGGYIQNLTGKNLTIHNSPTFLGIELLDKGIQASDPILGDPDEWTQLRNIRFDHIRVDNVSYLLRAQGVPPSRPVDGFTLAHVQGTCDRAITMANMKNVSLSGIKVTNYRGPLLTETHVEGTGLNDPN
jgi:Glycosyl hydrolases family 28